jgi:hypothetical protein
MKEKAIASTAIFEEHKGLDQVLTRQQFVSRANSKMWA